MRTLPARPVGRTGLEVSLLGFGGAPLGDLYALLDEDAAIGAVTAAAQAGVTLFDTSPLYGHGLSEHRIGTGLRRAGRDAIVSTKVGRVLRPARGPDWDREGYRGGLPFEAVIDYSREGALRSIEQSLVRLGRAKIDIALIHDVDVWTHGAAMIEQRFAEAMEGAYRALDDLRSQGVVSAIGVGVNEAEMCRRFAKAGDFDCMLLAGRYSLLEQGALTSFLPLAEERNIAILLGGVFNSGILATGAVEGAMYDYRPAPPEVMDRVARIEAVCRAHRVALPVAAMRFPLGHEAISSLVLGAVSATEVARNLDGLCARVPAALWADLKAERLIDAAAPEPPETVA